MRLRAILVGCAVLAAQDFSSYRAEIAKWRVEREARLKADDSWLTVAGLYWLKEGVNRAGSAAGNEMVLPSSAAPLVGRFKHHSGETVFTATSGVNVTVDGKPVKRHLMRPDTPGPPDIISVGNLSMFVIQRGTRFGIRLRDKKSKLRTEFRGLEWFPVDPRFRVTARWIPYEPPRQISVPNVLGDTEMRTSPGRAEFTLEGTACRLEPVLEDGRLFLIFRDLTTGKETYPAGRFLYADTPRDGKVVLDFNKAYNPPCAFTPYATCPLPPKQNRIPVRIPAGEKTYHH